MTESQKINDILIESNMYDEIVPIMDGRKVDHYAAIIPNASDTQRRFEKCIRIAPFADTLEGRKQADTIEDWLVKENKKLWAKSYFSYPIRDEHPTFSGKTEHQWRLDRIKWCIQELIK